MREKLVKILDEFRTLSHELHPKNLATLPLASNLRSLCQEFASQTGLRIKFLEETVPDRMPMPIAICLYRLTQESLNNIHKHANATHVLIRLVGPPGEVRLLITDDGIGFEKRRRLHPGKGLGLTSMEERIRPLGGHVSIESHPDQGTTVTAVIPLSAS